jgi:hypothetical protein
VNCSSLNNVRLVTQANNHWHWKQSVYDFISTEWYSVRGLIWTLLIHYNRYYSQLKEYSQYGSGGWLLVALFMLLKAAAKNHHSYPFLLVLGV